MEGLLYGIAVAVLLALLILIGWVISFIRRAITTVEYANGVLRQSQELIARLAEQLPTLLASIEQLSDKANQTLDNADQRLTVLGDTLENFRQVSQRINELEHRLQAKIEGPLMDAAKVITALNRAVKTFTDVFNRR